MSRPFVSAIIITHNEVQGIEAMLSGPGLADADELIVVDGDSSDGTVEVASRYARCIKAPPSRAGQMNAGAREAAGDVLLFLHADVRVEPGSIQSIREAMGKAEVVGGNLDVRFDGGDWVASAFNVIYHYRRYLGIFYGDSGIFCRRSVFAHLGGYREWPILEDYEFGRRLHNLGKMAYLNSRIHVSDRRWRKAGLIATMATWVWIQGAYTLGVSPLRLGRWYRHVR